MMKYGGLTEDETLAMLTINPAKQLDIDKRVGSIEVGKDADLTLWTRHLRSVTLTPAEFLGVADRLGSIDKGKVANVVVATGRQSNTDCQTPAPSGRGVSDEHTLAYRVCR